MLHTLTAPRRAMMRARALAARLGTLAVLGLVASPAAAQDLSAVTTMINTVVTALTGPIGVGLATLGIVFVGAMALMGQMRWGVALSVFAGIVLVFGAPGIVAGF